MDLIIGAIRHHFRSYLEAEPEVQAEIALYQSTRSPKPKGTVLEYTSRISNKLREMESGFKEIIPPIFKGFIVKRQAKLTHDQAKHLHFYIPTRGLEADKMIDALNRLDQTDALVEQILGDRAKLELHANRGLVHSNSHVQAYSLELETAMSSEVNHNHITSDTESDQLDWDPERIDGDVYLLVDENGSVPRKGPLEEDEASSLTAWAQGYREVRKKLRDSVTGRGYSKPESSRYKKVVRKTMFEKKPPKRDRNIRTPFRDKARDHSTECVTGAELRNAPVVTVADNLDIWRESVRIQYRRTSLNLQPRISFCQEMLLHSCIICHLTCCTMVHPRLWWDATLI